MPLKPLYTARRSLDIKVVTEFKNDKLVRTSVPGMVEHARLMGAEQHYRRFYEEHYRSKTAQEAIRTSNIGTASLSFLYSTGSLKKGDLDNGLEVETFDIADMNHKYDRSISVVDTFNPDADYPEEIYNVNGKKSRKKSTSRNSDFINHLQARIDQTVGVYKIPDNAITDVNEFSKHPQFPETFHHTEQAKNEVMIDTVNINNMVKYLLQLDLTFLVAIVEDFHTSRPMCINCNITECGCQQPEEGGFLYQFMTAFNAAIAESDQRVVLPVNGVTMHTRVSASMKSDEKFHKPLYKTAPITAIPLLINYDNKGVVLQKNAVGTQLAEDSLDYGMKNYYGDYFLSSQISTTTFDKKIIKMQNI